MQHMMSRASVFVITSMLAVVMVHGGARAQELGPVNPKLLEWLSKSEDLGKKPLGYVPGPIDWSHLQYDVSKDVPPAYFDLRNSGGVTSVKHQLHCGACWAFAACGVLESWLMHQSAGTYDLSENHMKNTHAFSIGHCAGGNNQIATAYLARFTGPLAEADDPYNPNQVVPPAAGALPQKLLTWSPVYTPSGGNTAAIKTAIMEHGALAAPMIWSDSAYSAATRTYYYSGGPNDGGHMIALVGWDDNKVVPGAPGNGAWICKNSWGPYWGESGYFYLSYHDIAAVDEAVGYFNLVDPAAYGTVYQHDTYGLTSYAGVPGPVIYGANVFVASQNGRLAAVGTYAMTSSTAYTITIYNSGYAGGFSHPAATISGTFDTAGYHVVDLPPTVNLTAGQAFSVVVRYETTGWNYPLPIEAPISGYAPATAGLGQSYISQNGSTWSDLHGLGGTFANGNACIKAITAPADPDPEGEGEPPAELLRIVGRVRVSVGDSVTLRLLTPQLVGHVQYAWYKDGQLLPQATTNKLYLVEVTLDDAGVYKAYATDESKGVYESEPFVLEVLLEGSLPAATLAAALLLALTIGMLAIWLTRRPAHWQ